MPINDINIPSVDITIGANMYGRISDLPNTPSHVLAEFVDNALQSYRDRKADLLRQNPDYRLRIDINFKWDKQTGSPVEIEIRDNAGGIDSHYFVKAFKLATTPENNQGLNEYGMGLKTAALWLGSVWEVKTTALGEGVERYIHFDQKEVVSKELKELSVTNKLTDENEHYTVINIKELTEKAPSNRSIDKIKYELSSIYRKSLRSNEADIYVDGDKIIFEELEILKASPVKSPNSPAVTWKKEIDFKFGKYRATGFVAILKDINSRNNGFVLLRRGRVVYGAETDGRYFPKSLSGSAGTFRYKRIFGEIELEGFAVAFNKNDLQDKENLEALMEALKSQVRTSDFDLLYQADEYRLDDRQKAINKIIKTHTANRKKNDKIEIVIPPKPTKVVEGTPGQTAIIPEVIPEEEPEVMGKLKDIYTINGIDYHLEVEMVDKGQELVWVDTSKKEDRIVICKINMNHIFFKTFQKSDAPVIALLKTMALAKFTAKEKGNDTTGELFDLFNDYINKAKI